MISNSTHMAIYHVYLDIAMAIYLKYKQHYCFLGKISNAALVVVKSPMLYYYNVLTWKRVRSNCKY